MTILKELEREFCKNDEESFTNYDYLMQLIDNGRLSVFKEFIQKLSHKALMELFKIPWMKSIYKNEVELVILNRMIKGFEEAGI